MPESTGGAQLTYQTDQWGGIEGCLHFEIQIGERVAQVTIDANGIEIFSPKFITLEEGGFSLNCARLRFCDSMEAVKAHAATERLREREGKLREGIASGIDFLAELAEKLPSTSPIGGQLMGNMLGVYERKLRALLKEE